MPSASVTTISPSIVQIFARSAAAASSGHG
jgi:hypothetical protein